MFAYLDLSEFQNCEMFGKAGGIKIEKYFVGGSKNNIKSESFWQKTENRVVESW